RRRVTAVADWLSWPKTAMRPKATMASATMTSIRVNPCNLCGRSWFIGHQPGLAVVGDLEGDAGLADLRAQMHLERGDIAAGHDEDLRHQRIPAGLRSRSPLGAAAFVTRWLPRVLVAALLRWLRRHVHLASVDV